MTCIAALPIMSQRVGYQGTKYSIKRDELRASFEL